MRCRVSRTVCASLALLWATSCGVMAAPVDPNQAFIADVMSTPGLTSTMNEYDLVQVGHGMCQVLAYRQYSREDLVTQMSSPNTKFEPDVTAVILDAAHDSLCPQYVIPRFST